MTHGGLEDLQERMCVRPTSETLFCDFYAKDIHSYRDLPRVYNQWCSVVRWEKTTRPFLRSREFLWQEGHTAHASAEEAEARTIQMLNLYADFCEEVLAIPVIKGQKTDRKSLRSRGNLHHRIPDARRKGSCSQVPAITLAMDLQRHLTSSSRTRIIH